MSKLISFLFAPEDTGGGGPVDDLSVQDLLNSFAEDDKSEDDNETLDLTKPKSPSKEKEEDKEKEKDEEDESSGDEEEKDEETLEDELEDELKEPDDEELDELNEETIAPPTRKAILKEFPELFKKFPQLEKSFYREQKYTEIYPSIKDAEMASEKAKTWDKLESELSEGNVSDILKAVADGDKNGFYKIVDNVLPAIREIDPAAAEHIYAGVIKEVITLMVDASGQAGNEGLKTAAALVHQFIFGPKRWEPHQPLARDVQKDPRIDEISKKEREFLEKQYKTASSEVATRVDNTIKGTIEKYIDPKNTMTDYVKGKAIDDVFAEVKNVIKGDKRFQSILNRLWERAAKNDFDDASKNAIRSALMSKAKQLLPTAIQKGRKVALGAGRVTKINKGADDQEPVKPGPNAKPGKTTAPTTSGKNYREAAKSIPKNVSTRDFLMSD